MVNNTEEKIQNFKMFNVTIRLSCEIVKCQTEMST